MSFAVNVLASVTAVDPIQSHEFQSVSEAKDFMFSDNNKTTPMELYEGFRFVARNFPNMYSGTVESRETAKALWLAGDDSWMGHDYSY